MTYHEAKAWSIQLGKLLRLPNWPADKYIFWSGEHTSRVEDIRPTNAIPQDVLKFEEMAGNKVIRVQGVMVLRTTGGVMKSYYPGDTEAESQEWELIELQDTWSGYLDRLLE